MFNYCCCYCVWGGVGTPNYGVSLASLISVLELLMLLPYRCTYEVSKRPHLSSRNVLTQFWKLFDLTLLPLGTICSMKAIFQIEIQSDIWYLSKLCFFFHLISIRKALFVNTYIMRRLEVPSSYWTFFSLIYEASFLLIWGEQLEFSTLIGVKCHARIPNWVTAFTLLIAKTIPLLFKREFSQVSWHWQAWLLFIHCNVLMFLRFIFP